MAALQCEICGGKLMGRPGGIFECESCGMQYDTAWAKAKVQEIRGTVQIDGTVEVTGTVKVEGGITAENLLKRANNDLADGNWESARQRYDEVLNQQAECAEAYFGIAMCQMKVTSLEAMVNKYYWDNKNYVRGKQFATGALKEQITALETAYSNRSRENTARLTPVRQRLQKVAGLLCAGSFHTLGVQSDGTVRAAGNPRDTHCTHAAYWSNIVAVAAGYQHSLALKADGTVLAIGKNDYHQCELSGQKNIKAIAAGAVHSVGLRFDGTVIITVPMFHSLNRTTQWRDIVAIAAGEDHTVGLKADGTVVADRFSDNQDYYYLQCEVSDWENIVAIAACKNHTIGVKADGTVVSCGDNTHGQCNVSQWTDIVFVATDEFHTIGLRADGTVVACGTNKYGQCNVAGWTNIVAIAAGTCHSIGLRADGTLVATNLAATYPSASGNQCNIEGWKLFRDLDHFEEERAEHRRQQYQLNLQQNRRNAGLCPYCGGQFTGFRGKTCANCGKSKDY